jgi:hypothetical protein
MTTAKTKQVLSQAGIPLEVYETLPKWTKLTISTQCRRFGKTRQDWPEYFDPLVIWMNQKT